MMRHMFHICKHMWNICGCIMGTMKTVSFQPSVGTKRTRPQHWGNKKKEIQPSYNQTTETNLFQWWCFTVTCQWFVYPDFLHLKQGRGGRVSHRNFSVIFPNFCMPPTAADLRLYTITQLVQTLVRLVFELARRFRTELPEVPEVPEADEALPFHCHQQCLWCTCTCVRTSTTHKRQQCQLHLGF